MDKLKEALTYDDVLLTPQYSDVESRKEIYIGKPELESGEKLLVVEEFPGERPGFGLRYYKQMRE